MNGLFLFDCMKPTDLSFQESLKRHQTLLSMLFKRSRKILQGSTHRSKSISDTLRKAGAKKILKHIGVTRISDITGLDFIGIPTYSAIRPISHLRYPTELFSSISVSNGKGITKPQAKVSAIMEAIERHSGESIRRRPWIASFEETSRQIPCIHPRGIDKQSKLDWTLALEVLSRRVMALEAVHIYSPYRYPLNVQGSEKTHSSNGLASGNTLQEASLHALLELIERHVILGSSEAFSIPPDTIDDSLLRRMLQKLKIHGFNIGLKYYHSPFGACVCRASIDDPITRDPALFSYGTGAHTSKKVALLRAITEAVQTRLTTISGIREDFKMGEKERKSPENYKRFLKDFNSFNQVKNPVSYQELPEHASEFLDADLKHIIACIQKAGFQQILISDLTDSAINIPVVRAFIPGFKAPHAH